MAYKKIEGQINKHSYTVSVVGLSGTESVKGRVGVGKSCLCNRFVRPAEDDFHNDHLSLLSAADFNGQVINNDHWLYWGLASRLADDGTEYSFNVVEQTEFLDDTTFAPLRGGKTDPYLKRCSQIKIQSAEKLMYICRDQLGLEDQFPEKKFPTGKVAVDGFVCVVDVSRSQDRSLESQLEFLSKILSALVKTKKPIVMAATKMDEGSEAVMLVG
ncbi:RhoGAPp190 [Bugula neritina]|uniref:RhoGAPp190 n=1 Tax=Bugula neritina TaxID=10212 RepID=A0A7J7K915_BUGNE|nr:RhoGAPp190 [Bugula neritina]